VRSNLHLLGGLILAYVGLLPFVSTRRWLKAIWAVAAGVLLIIFCAHAYRTIASGIASPPIWDFRCFWIYGRVIDVTHQPYAPSAMHAIGDALSYNRGGFSREVLDVGLVYPPPAVLLFAPLGLFASPNAALPFWYALLILALLAAVVLLWRIFLSDSGWIGLVVAALLVALFPTTTIIFSDAQTIYIALFFVLLYLREEVPLRQGVWLALATIVKPFVIVVLLYPLLRKQWNVLGSAIATALILTAAAIPIIGWNSVLSFITNSPGKRLPSYILTDHSNQSLLGWIERATHQQAEVTTAFHNPLYLLAAAVLTSITIWLIIKSGERYKELCIALLLPLALLIYPHDQFYYIPMLLVPIFLLWSRRATLPGGAVGALAFTLVEFFVSGVENAQIYDALLAWIVLACLLAANVAASHEFTAQTRTVRGPTPQGTHGHQPWLRSSRFP
jgi:hypothetical protein